MILNVFVYLLLIMQPAGLNESNKMEYRWQPIDNFASLEECLKAGQVLREEGPDHQPLCLKKEFFDYKELMLKQRGLNK